MCAACDLDDNSAAGPGFPLNEIVEAVRLLEGELFAEPAGQKMWAIFFGLETGSIEWALFEDMRRCHDAALELLMERANVDAGASKYRLGRRSLPRGRRRSVDMCLG